MTAPAISLALALVPSWLLVRYFHDRDHYPEPPRVIWTTFALGGLTVVPVMLVVLPFIILVRPNAGPVVAGSLYAFAFAAVPEEFFKLLVLLKYSLRRREFDEPMDGLVYGTVASLGFAAFENALYSVSGGVSVAIARAFTAVPAHACMGITMGYFAGRARFEPHRGRRLIATGYMAAVLMHGLYDTPLMIINAISARYGEIPDELAQLGGYCVFLGLMALVVSMVIAHTLWRRARKQQLEHPVPPPVPGIAGALPPPLPAPHPASVASPRDVRAATLAPMPTHLVVLGTARVMVGIALSAFGGSATFSAIHALLDPSVGRGQYDSLATALLLVGIVPLALGARLFRAGVRTLNTPNPTDKDLRT